MSSHTSPLRQQGPIATRGTKVDVRISCRNLVSLDTLPPSSFVVIFSLTPGKSDWIELTRSETSPRNANPDYRRIFQMEYRFELYQQLRIVAFERCTESENLQQQTLIGAGDCTLGSIVSAHGSSLDIPLINVSRGGQNVGHVVLSSEEIISAKKMVTLDVSLSSLMRPDQRLDQQIHLDALRVKAKQTINRPSLPMRGAAALLGRFRKQGENGSSVLPAHLENQAQAQVQEREELNQQIAAATVEQSAPPPFVPFLTILRAPKAASSALDIRSNEISWEEAYTSIHIQNYSDLSTGYKLDPFTLSEYDLSEGDNNRFLKLAVCQANAGGTTAIIGEHITTFPALRRACLDQENVVLSLEPNGQLTIHKYSEEMQQSFVDYLRGGWCDFGLICAIDFTSSNGDPRQPGSRHYMLSPSPNEYEAAMCTVGNMLGSYSSDVRIPAYGFGANLPPQYNVSHCFPVSENELGDPFCNGVDGLIRAYKATLGRIQLYGPTLFSEVLRTVGVIVSRRTEAATAAGNSSLAYTVLLILTDGIISDYDATVAELIRLSALPLSVIIVGVGNEDFGRMHSLDCSKGPLRRGTEFAKREFVQFVPYHLFQGDLSMLAEKVLGGIPDQVVSYIEKIRGGNAPGF